jgi:hypothetical protein
MDGIITIRVTCESPTANCLSDNPAAPRGDLQHDLHLSCMITDLTNLH